MPDSTSLAEIKISELPVATSINPTDQLEANQAGTTRSITVGQVAATVPPPTWATIPDKPTTFPPTLPIAESDVTNLVSDLAAKAPLASPTFTGDPKAPTPTAGDNDTSIATTAFVATAVAGVTPTLPAGAVGYGSAGNVLTGVLANMAFDATNKRLGINKAAPAAALDVVGQANTAAITMSGYSLTGSNATGCFLLTAALNTTGQPDIFAINVTDTSNAGGNAFVIRGGPSGTANLIRTTMSGDTRVAGWAQARVNDALATNGRDYFAYYLGNGSGGNIGMFAGLSNPTFSTFGRYGSIYLDGASPGLPYYNNNGTTGWDRLVGETSTQTLTNKTFAPASISPGTNGQVLTTVSGAAAWATPSGGGTGDFMAQNSGGMSGLSGTYSKVIFPVVATGNSGGWYSTSTGRYTPPAGRYYISVVLNGASTGAADLTAAIYKNGTAYAISGNTTAAGGYSGSPLTEVIVDANGTDYFEFWARGDAATSFSGRFLAYPLTGLTGPTGPAGPDSKLLQTVFTETGAMATGSTLIPFDDTIPQITEGDQYMSLAITPKSATSKLVIEVVWNGALSVAGSPSVALFQDSTANALAAVVSSPANAGYSANITLRHTMTSGTTSATTFKVRAGPNTAGTVTFNGQGGGRIFGGAMASSIVIREVV